MVANAEPQNIALDEVDANSEDQSLFPLGERVVMYCRCGTDPAREWGTDTPHYLATEAVQGSGGFQMSNLDSSAILRLADDNRIPTVIRDSWRNRTGHDPVDVLCRCSRRRNILHYTVAGAFIVLMLATFAPYLGASTRFSGIVMYACMALITGMAIFFKYQPEELFPNSTGFENAFGVFSREGGLRVKLTNGETPKSELRRIAHELLVAEARHIIDWEDYHRQYPHPDNDAVKRAREQNRDQLFSSLVLLDLVLSPHKQYFDEARRQKAEAEARRRAG